MKLVLLTSMLISLIFSLVNHPMVMIILISSQTLMVCLMISLFTWASWFSFILFLVFMGGLMVLFVYVASLASNESFSTDILSLNPTPLILLLLSTAMFMTLNWQTYKSIQLISSNLIYKIYSPSMMYITGMTMVFLLLVLIVIVNITTMKEGSLRSIN